MMLLVGLGRSLLDVQVATSLSPLFAGLRLCIFSNEFCRNAAVSEPILQGRVIMPLGLDRISVP